VTVGNPAEQPTAKRAHEEAGSEDAGRGEELAGAVAAREKRRGEIEGRECVSVEIVPFDQIARGGADNGEDAPTGIGRIGWCVDGNGGGKRAH
jgi:hypothetical protein